MLSEILFCLGMFLISRQIQHVPIHTTIYDIGHEYIPKYIPNISKLAMYIFLQFFSLFLPVLTYFAVGFSLFYLFIMHILRIPAYWMTLLPVLDNIEHRFYNQYLIGLAGGNSDYIWSGHASTAMFSSVALYYHYSNVPCLLSLVIYNLILGIFIIGTKNHYSVDVYLGWLIGYLFGNTVL